MSDHDDAELVARAFAGARQVGWQRANCPLCLLATGKPDTRQSMGLNFATGGFVCFAGETRVLTSGGYREIRELSGGSSRLLCLTARGPKWVDAPIRSFGIAEVLSVRLSRNGVEKTVRVTAEHRWFVRSKGGYAERVTSELRSGHRLRSSPFPRSGTLRPLPWGVAHGFVFGDGTRHSRSDKGCRALFFLPKDAPMLEFFPFSRPRVLGKHCLRIDGVPHAFKALPDLDETPSYLFGWLAGYFAADGTVDVNGHPVLASSSIENLEFVRKVCIRLGVRDFGVRSYMRAGIGGVLRPIHYLGFARSDLPEAFYLLPHHKLRARVKAGKYDRVGWQVKAVERTGVTEEVFCATVEGVGNFVLEGNILTGNCHKCGATGLVPAFAPEEALALPDDLAAPAVEPPAPVEDPVGCVPIAEEPGLSARSLDWARAYMEGRGVPWEAVVGAEVWACNSGSLRGRVVVPHWAPDGSLAGWVGRDVTGKAHLRYRYSKGMKRALLWNQRALQEDTDAPLALVEGVFDALPLWPDVCAFLGKPTQHHVQTLSAHRGRPLVVMLDGDARHESWALAMKLKLAGVPSVGCALLPAGEDPGSLGRVKALALARAAVGKIPRG